MNELKIHRRYDESRTFYENPGNIRNDVARTALRSPNYLALSENGNYDPNACSSPRNVLNNSPRNYIADVSNNYEVTPLDKPRLPNNIYNDDHRPIGEFSYCETNTQTYNKDEYVSNLHSALTNVQSIDNIRGYECAQYGQNCDRFPYGGKKGR